MTCVSKLLNTAYSLMTKMMSKLMKSFVFYVVPQTLLKYKGALQSHASS